MTSDPRRVPAALPIPHLTFEEATELAFFGAAVLHPLAMQPALQNGRLDVRVKNSYNRRAAQLSIAPIKYGPGRTVIVAALDCRVSKLP